MRFFVVAPDGQRYGPADVALLNQWVQEGRLLPDMELEEEGTGRRVRANSVAGLSFGQRTTYAQPPNQGTYLPPSVNMSPIVPSQSTDRLVSQSWNMGIAGLACVVALGCCPPMPLIAAIFGAIGLNHAHNARTQGSDKFQGPMILNGVVLALAVLSLLGAFGGFFHFGFPF